MRKSEWTCSATDCENETSEFQYFCSDRCQREYNHAHHGAMADWNDFQAAQSRAAIMRYRSLIDYRNRHQEERRDDE